MPKMDAIDVLKDLKTLYNESKSIDVKIKNEVKNKLARTYIVYGEDPFVRERMTQRLKQIMANYNATVERITFDKTDMQEWIDNLYDMPMFNPTKLVIASELYTLREEQLDTLIRYLKEPSPEVVLFLLSSRKYDKRRKKLNGLCDYAVACDSEIKPSKGKDNSFSTWIAGFAAERGKSIEDTAVDFLITRYGTELARIEKEIEKASTFIGSNPTIREKDIEFISTGFSSFSVFDIYKHLASKNKKKLLEIIYRLVESGENPVFLNSTISSRVKKLLMVCDLIKEKPGIQDKELARHLGLKNEKAVYFFKSELRGYKREELANMYKRCMNIDSELKSQRRNKKDILISGVMKLIERR